MYVPYKTVMTWFYSILPHFSGTNLINKAFLTAEFALLKLDLDVRNKVERITFESPVTEIKWQQK